MIILLTLGISANILLVIAQVKKAIKNIKLVKNKEMNDLIGDELFDVGGKYLKLDFYKNKLSSKIMKVLGDSFYIGIAFMAVFLSMSAFSVSLMEFSLIDTLLSAVFVAVLKSGYDELGEFKEINLTQEDYDYIFIRETLKMSNYNVGELVIGKMSDIKLYIENKESKHAVVRTLFEGALHTYSSIINEVGAQNVTKNAIQSLDESISAIMDTIFECHGTTSDIDLNRMETVNDLFGDVSKKIIETNNLIKGEIRK